MDTGFRRYDDFPNVKRFMTRHVKNVPAKDKYELAREVGKMLKMRGETVSVAESCTGGLVAAKLTDVPGSSSYFLEGLVVYSNAGKMRLLGVKKTTLAKFGAVSAQTVKEMAKGLLKVPGCDWAVSVTGIAGPSGGSRHKPVGTVWFGIGGKPGINVFLRKFRGGRPDIRSQAAVAALELLKHELKR